jgi:hypothetical protein
MPKKKSHFITDNFTVQWLLPLNYVLVSQTVYMRSIGFCECKAIVLPCTNRLALIMWAVFTVG